VQIFGVSIIIFHLESERRAPYISSPSRAKILRFKNGVQLLIIELRVKWILLLNLSRIMLCNKKKPLTRTDFVITNSLSSN
jgi:hypothetical protein